MSERAYVGDDRGGVETPTLPPRRRAGGAAAGAVGPLPACMLDATPSLHAGGAGGAGVPAWCSTWNMANLTHTDIERILCNAKDEINVVVGVTDYIARCFPEDLPGNEAWLLLLAVLGLVRLLINTIFEPGGFGQRIINQIIDRLEQLVIDKCEPLIEWVTMFHVKHPHNKYTQAYARGHLRTRAIARATRG